MHIKKLYRGFSMSVLGGAAISPFILLSCSTMENCVFIAIWCTSAFVFVSITAAFLGRWYRGAEYAAVTLAVSSFTAYLLYALSGRGEYENAFILMIISFVYLVSRGTDNYSRRLELSWSAGVSAGIFAAAICIGSLVQVMPANPGFRFISAAFFVVLCRRVFAGMQA
jgi:hypothetical protein